MDDLARPTRARVPLRRSLVTRLIAMSLVVCAVSVAATAWLVVRSTQTAIEQVNGQNLHDDAIVYDALLDWAESHQGWAGVAPVLTRLADRTGYRIQLTDVDGRPLADSAPAGSAPAEPAPAGHEAEPATVDLADTRVIVDPDQVDWFLLQHAPGHEPGPARTTEPPAQTERGELDQQRRSAAPAAPGSSEPAPEAAREALDERAERAATAALTAPPARLFITGGQPAASAFVDLSTNSTRIAVIAALVLAAASAVSIAVGLRITRPLRELSRAARQMTDGDDDARADVRVGDEIGQVAVAFNSLAARRSEQERLRRAMVSDIAHELRTPLSTIRGWLEAAQDRITPLDDRLVGSLHEEAMHLQHLVADLQDLALGDAGELRLHTEPVDLTAHLEQVVLAHEPLASSCGVTLEASTEPGLVVEADPVRLRQAVTNLVVNAVRHSPEGGHVQVRGRAAPADALGQARKGAAGAGTVRTGTVVIEVRDTGEGIAPSDLPHVFERFWRADRSRVRGTGGTGLGLAIVRQVADLHGGRAEVSSRPGAGTVFTISVPGRPERAATSEVAVAEVAVAEATSSAQSN